MVLVTAVGSPPLSTMSTACKKNAIAGKSNSFSMIPDVLTERGVFDYLDFILSTRDEAEASRGGVGHHRRPTSSSFRRRSVSESSDERGGASFFFSFASYPGQTKSTARSAASRCRRQCATFATVICCRAEASARLTGHHQTDGIPVGRVKHVN